jgi:penicillin-binding protein 1A
MVSAYSMMVNGGKKITPLMIEKIQDRDGKTIYRRDKRQCQNCYVSDLNSHETNLNDLSIPILDESKEQITDSATAYQITSMLQGVVERGTAGRARGVGKIIGGKTGTTNNSYDSWFIGFSPDLVVGVYLGFDTPKTLGSDETGASVALPVFVNFMKEALKNTPSTPFRVPSTVKFVKIDRVTGKFPTPATEKDRIFFEAFKLDDSIESPSDEDLDQSDKENDTNLDSKEPSGIY